MPAYSERYLDREEPPEPSGGEFSDFSPPALPGITATFFGEPGNPPPSIPGDYFSPGPASGGVFADLSGLLTNLFALNSRPNTSTTIAPVTETYVDNRVNINNTGVNEGFMSDLFGRITSLLSVPQGGGGGLPDMVPRGYALNPAQSKQRQGLQTIATVQGIGGSSSPGRTGSSLMFWMTLAGLALSAFLIWKNFARK